MIGLRKPLTASRPTSSLTFGSKRIWWPVTTEEFRMQPTPVPLDQVDLADLDTFERNQAWGMCDTLRREAPVHWNPEHDGGAGFWSITRYDDIEMIDKDPETFTSTRFTNLEEPPEEHMDTRRSILETDGPRHQSLRKLLMRDFSAAQLRRYEDFLRGLAALTVDAALQ